MIFADASALVAIIADEPQALALTIRLDRDTDRICSAMSCWETMAALCRSYSLTPAAAVDQTDRYLEAAGFRTVPIGAREYQLAADAFARFGRGRHKAALNLGDCFAYACARANNATLLFVGDDFTHTDIRAAA